MGAGDREPAADQRRAVLLTSSVDRAVCSLGIAGPWRPVARGLRYLGSSVSALAVACSDPDTGLGRESTTSPPPALDPADRDPADRDPAPTVDPSGGEPEPTTRPPADDPAADDEPIDVVDPATTTWVAVADEADGTGAIYTSVDGTTWEHTHTSGLGLRAIGHDGERFVAAGGTLHGQGVILASDDGFDWAEVATTEHPILGLAAGEDTWVAFAGTSFLATWTSGDGLAWSGPHEVEVDGLHFGDPGTRLQSLAHGDGRFLGQLVDCGNVDCFEVGHLTSEDGVEWASDHALHDTALSAVPFSWNTVRLGFASGFALVGSAEGSAAAAVLEGGSWELVRRDGTGEVPLSLASDGETWIAVGSATAGREPNGVLVSTDLVTWTRVATIDARLTDVVVAGTLDLAALEPQPTPEPEPGVAGECPSTSELEAAFEVTLSTVLVLGSGLRDVECAGDWVRATTDPDPNMFDPAQVYFRIEGANVVAVGGGTGVTCDEIGIPPDSPGRQLCEL